MEKRRALAAGGLALAAWAGIAGAAQQPDPDWPCVQRRVPELTAAQMWAGPPPSGEASPEIEELARHLAARRVPVEEVGAEAAGAVEGLDPAERGERLAELFGAVLHRLNAERGQIIAGIGRYARHQTALSDRIEAMQLELAGLEAAPDDAKDWDRIEELRDTLLWETRVFKERAQSLSYVCETPVLLEQRAFAIARALAGLL
jgi:hypothetical protein